MNARPPAARAAWHWQAVCALYGSNTRCKHFHRDIVSLVAERISLSSFLRSPHTEKDRFVSRSDPASGLAMDYFKAVGGVKYTSAPELREGLNHSGFLAKREQIQPSFDEFWNGLTTNVAEIERRINGGAVATSSPPTEPAIVVVVVVSVLLCTSFSIFH